MLCETIQINIHFETCIKRALAWLSSPLLHCLLSQIFKNVNSLRLYSPCCLTNELLRFVAGEFADNHSWL